jgi:hypothetical protein
MKKSHARYTWPILFSALLAPTWLEAGVQIEERNQVQFSGMLGRMFGMLGGRAAREGVTSTSVVVGNRKVTRVGDAGEIVDLDEEKVYQVDWRRRQYSVTTFEELRREMAEAAEEMTRASRREEVEAPQEGESEYEFDFELRETGQTRDINGFDCREVSMIVTARQKGQTIEEGGGMILNTSVWLTETVAGTEQVAEFDRRYAEKLMGTAAAGVSADQMAAIAALYPALTEAMTKLEAEKVDMEGTTVLSTLTVETVPSKAEAAEVQREESAPASVGGALGGLARRMGRRTQEEPQSESGPAAIMTVTSELLSVSVGVGPEAVEIPAEFRERRR